MKIWMKGEWSSIMRMTIATVNMKKIEWTQRSTRYIVCASFCSPGHNAQLCISSHSSSIVMSKMNKEDNLGSINKLYLALHEVDSFCYQGTRELKNGAERETLVQNKE